MQDNTQRDTGNADVTDPVDLDAWKALDAHRTTLEGVHMRDLFRDDAGRFDRFTATACGLFLDYSKNMITDDTMPLLFDLLTAAGFDDMRARMLSGEKINYTDERAVLHVALRNRSNDEIKVDDENVMPGVNAVLDKMRAFTDSVRSGDWKGHSGKRIHDIVNIGIGGQNLGPRMISEALKPHLHPELDMHFVSNVDGTHITETLKTIDPETALFLISSKSFTTQETMANAKAARDWLVRHYDGDESAVAKHFVAISTNTDGVREFGIDADNMFEFWDWVGGRFSLWSASGLILATGFGMDVFEGLLSGAHEMDRHFATAPLTENLPVLLGLIGVWNRNFWNRQAYAVVPYDQYLRQLPVWLQQVDMESNGKTFDRTGRRVRWETGPLVFGEPGTDAQHSFFQLMHQGTSIVPADFIGVLKTHNPVDEQHTMLLANCLAQSEAMMTGQDNPDEPHRIFEGNRPTNTLLLEELTPKSLGSLMALYEHKIFVQGVVWNINSFDQYGVELGKVLANTILDELRAGKTGDHDASTTGLMQRVLDA